MPPPGQRLAQRKARKEKQGQIRFCTPNNRRSRYAETQFHDRPGKAQGRRGCRYAPDRFARPSLHEETARTGRLFVSAIFSSTGRGAFSFGKTKENGGRIPRGVPAPQEGEGFEKRRADIESAPTGKGEPCAAGRSFIRHYGRGGRLFGEADGRSGLSAGPMPGRRDRLFAFCTNGLLPSTKNS